MLSFKRTGILCLILAAISSITQATEEKDCSKVVEAGGFMQVRSVEYSDFTRGGLATDGSGVADLGTDAVGKCLYEEFESTSDGRFQIIEILSDEVADTVTDAFQLVKSDDLNGIISKFAASTDASGLDINRTDLFGRSLLSLAVSSGYADVAKALILSGADVNARVGRGGATTLMMAAINDDVSLTQLLLKKGADVNAVVTNKDMPIAGYNALHLAGSRGAADTFELLIRSGVDLHATGYNGKDAIEAMRDTLVSGSSQKSATIREGLQDKYSKLSAILTAYREKLKDDKDEL